VPLLRVMHNHLARLRQWVITKLRVWTKPYPHMFIIGTLTDLRRSKHQLMLENALLRQQLIVVSRQVKRPKLTWHDRARVIVLVSRLKTWKHALLIVKPETVLRWHRDLFRQVWRRKSRAKSRVGRPPLARESVALIRRLQKRISCGDQNVSAANC
jgi:putative transposase